MPLWGNSNAKAKAPKYKVVEAQVAAGPSKGTNTLFNNTTPGVFKPGQVLGVWGANATQVASNPGRITHTGWHLARQGTGPVKSFTIVAIGNSYVNGAVLTVTSPQAGGNAHFTATTNSIGGITALTFLSGNNAGFVNTSATVVYPANGISNVVIGGGLGYSNADTIVFSNGQVNATATLVTNATGGITSVTLVTAGRGFPSNTGTVVTITTSGGTNGNVVVNVLGAGQAGNVIPVLGGRAGRVHFECLVAGSMTGSPPATLP